MGLSRAAGDDAGKHAMTTMHWSKANTALWHRQLEGARSAGMQILLCKGAQSPAACLLRAAPAGGGSGPWGLRGPGTRLHGGEDKGVRMSGLP